MPADPTIDLVTVCPNPIFVIGSPRSGTTALARALGAHSRLWTSHESYFIHNLFGSNRATKVWQRQTTREKAPSWLRTEDVGLEEFMAALGTGINALFSSRSGGRRWVEQTPLYTVMVDDLAMMFPGATFVHILRDGRSVVASMSSFLNKFRHRPEALQYVPRWASDFTEACRTWRRWVDVAAEFGRRHPDRTVTVRSEDMEADPVVALAAVFAALGEEPEAAPVELLRQQRVNSSFGERGAAQPPWHEWDLERRQTFVAEAGSTMVVNGIVAADEMLRWVTDGVAV